MEHDKLLNLSTELGYHLMLSGAEIYRVEDSIRRLLCAYGLDSGEVFAIPNCLTVSLLGQSGQPMTRIRRIPSHGTSIEKLEQYNALCRQLCRDTPPFEEAMESLLSIAHTKTDYPTWLKLLGYYAGGFFYCLFFHGSFIDALISGLCCVLAGGCLLLMGRVESNVFFQTLAAASVSGLLGFGIGIHWPGLNADIIIIGAYMALVPGVSFTTALRDIMAGDMVSGIAKAAEGIFIAVAIVLGTSFAVTAAHVLVRG